MYPTWAIAARIVFAFSLQIQRRRGARLLASEAKFGYVQDSAISNYIQAALMFKYNQRKRWADTWADNATVGSAVWRRARLIAGLRKGECLLCERSELGICF